MTNAGEYKPVINELVDLLNRQRDMALDLLKKVKTSDNDQEFLWAIRGYIESVDAQAEALEKVVRMTETSFENDEYKKLSKK